MAPGPIGQTAALPNDPELKRQMLQTARNHRTVFKRYNFDIKPKKGSFLWKAMHSWAKTEAEREAEEDFEDEMWGLTSRCAASLVAMPMASLSFPSVLLGPSDLAECVPIAETERDLAALFTMI